MKEIFADFYNKIVDFFSKEEEKDKTKDVARNRLKLVLMQDRTNLNPRLLERLRGEMIDLLSKYVVMDKELLELNFTPEDDQLALMLSIPVIRAKDEDEIEEALKAEDEEKARLAKLIEEAEAEEEADEDEDEEYDESEDTEEDETEDDSDDEDLEEETSDENEKTESDENSDSEDTKKVKKFKKKKHKKKHKQNVEETSEPKSEDENEDSEQKDSDQEETKQESEENENESKDSE